MKSHHTLFQLPSPNKQNGAVDNAICIQKIYRHEKTCLDILRHCPGIKTCHNISVHTSRHCVYTLKITLEKGLKRKKIIYISYDRLEGKKMISFV